MSSNSPWSLSFTVSTSLLVPDLTGNLKFPFKSVEYLFSPSPTVISPFLTGFPSGSTTFPRTTISGTVHSAHAQLVTFWMLYVSPLPQVTGLSDLEAGLQHCRVDCCPPQLEASPWLRLMQAAKEQVPTSTLLLPLLSSVHPGGKVRTFFTGVESHESSPPPIIESQ